MQRGRFNTTSLFQHTSQSSSITPKASLITSRVNVRDQTGSILFESIQQIDSKLYLCAGHADFGVCGCRSENEGYLVSVFPLLKVFNVQH